MSNAHSLSNNNVHTVSAGDDLVLQCKAYGVSNEINRAYWIKNENFSTHVELNATSTYQREECLQTATLNLTKLSLNDSGTNYTCIYYYTDVVDTVSVTVQLHVINRSTG